jgi:hypothetical protein
LDGDDRSESAIKIEAEAVRQLVRTRARSVSTRPIGHRLPPIEAAWMLRRRCGSRNSSNFVGWQANRAPSTVASTPASSRATYTCSPLLAGSPPCSAIAPGRHSRRGSGWMCISSPCSVIRSDIQGQAPCGLRSRSAPNVRVPTPGSRSRSLRRSLHTRRGRGLRSR